MRDAILTCARKPSWVSLIYRTETTTKKCKTEKKLKSKKRIYSTQLNEHVRTQVLTPQCPHLFNTTTYETTHLLLHVLIYLQFWSGRLCNHTRYPGATKTYLICPEVTVNSPGNRARRSAARTYLRRRRNFRDDYLYRFRRVRNMKTWG